MNVRPSCSGLLPGCSVTIPFCVHTVSAVLPSSGLEVGVWLRSRALVRPVWVTPPASAGFRCDQEGETLRGAVKQPPKCVSSQGQGRGTYPETIGQPGTVPGMVPAVLSGFPTV